MTPHHAHTPGFVTNLHPLATHPVIGILTYHLIDGDLVLLSASDGASKMLKIDCSTRIGLTIEEAFPGLADTEMPTRYRRVATDGVPWSAEHVEYSDGVINGAYEVHAFRTSPMHVTVVFMDVTQRKQNETEREQLDRQLQHMQKLESLGGLAGGIAHSFNNLLCGILGSADLLLMDMDETNPSYQDLAMIKQTARKASELCTQLLAYSGKGRFVVEAVNLTDMVLGIANLLKISMARTVTLDMNLSPGLPPIDSDPGQIQQVILNLAVNASEAIQEESGTVRITTDMCELSAKDLRTMTLGQQATPGPYACIEVSDTGCGMKASTMAQIFDPFFSTKFTGRGLGLAATLGIVKTHGGVLHVASAWGKGTTVRVCFPVGTKTQSPACALPPAQDWTGSGTVLLIDDESTVRAVGKRILQTLGFDVIVAEDGQAGIDLFEKHADIITLVLLDMTMPRMDGAEVFRIINHAQPDLPVLLMSGYDKAEAIARFTEKGLAGFVEKPFSIASLRNSLLTALENTR